MSSPPLALRWLAASRPGFLVVTLVATLVGIAQLRGKVQRRAFGHDGGQCAFALIDDGNDAFCHVGVFCFLQLPVREGLETLQFLEQAP